MNILYAFDRGLPDTRIENAARSAKSEGHQVYFAGNFQGGFRGNLFEEVFRIPFNTVSRVGVPFYWNKIRSAFLRAVNCCRPDIVHASDLFAAKLALESSLPYVYDDREYWSRFSRISSFSKPTHTYRWLLWSRWESEVLRRSAAVLTVSETIANEHRRIASKVFTVPNVPRVSELPQPGRGKPSGELHSVYIGADAQPPYTSYRNLRGFLDIFRSGTAGKLYVYGDNRLRSTSAIISRGYLPHAEMMKDLVNHHVGIIPWQKHWFHYYCNPNKPYEYALAGLTVLCINDMVPVVDTLGEHCRTFDGYVELREQLEHYGDNIPDAIETGLRTREFAAKYLVWERFESKVLEAYSVALKS